MNKRLELLNEQSFLEENHCTDCELKTKQRLSCYQYMPYCLDVCNIGKRIREIGRELDPSFESTKRKKLDAETKSKITGMYQFKSPREIAEKLGIDRGVISRFLVNWVKEKKIILDHYKYDTRRIIELDHQGLSVEEISDKTNESKSRVKAVLEREYKRMREGNGKI